MSKSRSGVPKRVAAGLLAGALSVVGLAFAPSAGAVEDVESTRLAGATRYGTAADIAAGELGAFDGATTAILATGENFPDALAASGLAGVNAPAPILLTRTAFLSEEALAALDELAVTDVIIVGGTAAVSDDVADTLTGEGYNVDRVAGVDRYETAAEIAGEVGCADLNGLATALIATGLNYPDALAGGPIAYIGGFPILLTNDGVPASTEAALTACGAEQVVLLGGTAAVPTAVENELEELTGNDALRWAGVNRYSTAVDVADEGMAEDLLDAVEVLLASGENFPDALAGGPLGGELTAPILLTPTASLASETEAWLNDHSDTITDLIILGGTAAIAESTAAAAEAAAEDLEGDPVDSNASFGVDTTTSQVFNLDDPAVSGERSYNFTGLDPTKTYDIELYPCGEDDYDAPIQSDGERYPSRNGDSVPGTFTFQDWGGDLTPDWNGGDTFTDNAEILAVNQETINSSGAYDKAATASGTMNVILTSTGADCAIPVLWEDAGGDDDVMKLAAASRNTYNVPAEKFAVGGASVWYEGEAPSGTEYDDDVVFIDTDENYFILDDGYRYNYGRPGDTYFYEGSEVEDLMTIEDFETVLSLGDYLYYCSNNCSPYFRNGNTLFTIDDDTPGTPGTPTATTGNFDNDNTNDDIRFTWPQADPLEGNLDEATVEAYMITAADGTLTYITSWDTAETNSMVLNSAPTTLTVIDHGLASGLYRFCVYIDSETDDSGSCGQLSAPVQVGTALDTTKPTIVDARVVTDAGLQNVASDGDVYRLDFSEDMNATTASGQFVVTDADGDVITIACDVAEAAADDITSATCVLGPDGAANTDRRLTITLLEDADDTNLAGNGSVAIPLTITTTDADVKDETGNVVDVAGSADNSIDKEV